MADGARSPAFLGTKRLPLPEHSVVRLISAVRGDGIDWPVGARGTIVHVYRGGVAYEVEFSHPQPAVVTVEADQLAPA